VPPSAAQRSWRRPSRFMQIAWDPDFCCVLSG
jgi:hypothetical protein